MIPVARSEAYSITLAARVPQAAGAPGLIEVGPIFATSFWFDETLSSEAHAQITVNAATLPTEVASRLADLYSFPSEVWIRRESEMVFAGPVVAWNPTRTAQGVQIQIAARDLWHYVSRWYVEPNPVSQTERLDFIGVDQYEIARGLIDYYQALPYGSVGIDTSDTSLSGVTRTARYLKAEGHNIAERIEELGERIGGFDFYIDPATRALVMGSPIGIETSVVADVLNLEDLSLAMSVGPGDVVSEAYGLSDAEGGTLISHQSDLDTRQTFGRFGSFHTFDEVQLQATLDDHTGAIVADRSNMRIGGGFELTPVEGADFGDFGRGDTIETVIDVGVGVFRCHRRILRRRVSVNQGVETIAVELT